MAITYPYRVFRYEVSIGGFKRAGFSEVSGMNLSTQVVEYREGNDLRNTPRKLPGLTTYGNVTLRWGITDDKDFLEWIHSVAPDDKTAPKGIQRYDVTIKLIDDAGKAGTSWVLKNAWPVSFTAPDLSGMGNEIAVASLELCHEGLWMTPSATPGPASAI